MTDGKTAKEALAPLLATSILFLFVNTLFVAFRFWARLKLRPIGLGWDDWLLLPALICSLACCAIGIAVYHFESIGNVSAYMNLIEPYQYDDILVPVLKLIYSIVQTIYGAYTLPRLSLCALYLRIFENKRMRLLLYVLIVLNILSWIGMSLAGIFICNPPRGFWNKKMNPPASCFNINAYNRYYSVPTIVLDFLMLLLPVRQVWDLKASRQKKLALTALFLTGVLGIGASIIRWVIFQHYDNNIIAPYVTGPLISWSIVEPSMYLIAACLPALAPVAIALTPRFIRRHMSGKMRSRQNPKRLSLKSLSNRAGGSAGSFSRLVDRPNPTYCGPKAQTMSDAKGTPGFRLGDKSGGVLAMQEGLGAEDLEMMRTGAGIAVKTEIVITQEDRIDRVLGL